MQEDAAHSQVGVLLVLLLLLRLLLFLFLLLLSWQLDYLLERLFVLHRLDLFDIVLPDLLVVKIMMLVVRQVLLVAVGRAFVR